MKFKMRVISILLMLVMVSTNMFCTHAVGTLKTVDTSNIEWDTPMIKDTVYPTLKLTTGNWKLNERSGSTANDTSLFKTNGTIYGASWTPGISGTGLSFNGSTSYVSIPNASQLNYSTSQSFSLSAWVYIPSLQNKWQGVVTKGSWKETSAWYGIWISGDNRWVFGANGNNIFGSKVTTGWHHVAAVQDGSSNKRYLYVDSALVATGNASNGSSTAPLWIGGCKATSEYFKGTIDEVNLTNYVLSQSSVKSAYQKYAPAKLAEWTFDEAGGSTVADSSGNAYNGAVYSGSYWDAGKSASCVRYYGYNYMAAPSNDRFNFTKEDSFTMTAWVNVPQNSSRWQGVITKGRGTSSWYGLWISSDNRWVFGGNGGNIYGSNVTTGWHHIALVQDGPNHRRYLYVDGNQVAWGYSYDGSSSARFMVGGCEGASEYFNGRVDEVNVYNYKLSSTFINNDAKEYDHKLNVQTYTQQPYNQLCWATTASMMISYFLDDIRDRKVEIAQDLYGNTDFNHPGTWGNMLHYISKYTGRTGTYGSGALSFNGIASNIDSDRPIPYTVYWSSGGGHALVMRGYMSVIFPWNTSATNYVLINDPWDGRMHIYTDNYLRNNSSFTWNGYATY